MAERYSPALEIAWAAGLFEGEGSIVLRPSNKGSERKCIRLSMAMTDEDVVKKFRQIVGIGRVRYKNTTVGKDLWYWEASRLLECQALLEAFLPFLGERRSLKALEGLTFTLGTPGTKRGEKRGRYKKGVPSG